MAPPDDQSAPPPLSVTDYYFEDPSGNPVSFAAALPVLFDGDELSVAVDALQVSLRGTASSGKVFERVVGWRLECEDVWPEVWVLAEDGRWVKLLKPWKPYEEGAARTALITLHMIHFLSRKPESSANRVLFHLHQVFRFKNEPTMDDFKEHSELIKKFFSRDELLAKSSLSAMFFLESPTNRMLSEDTRNELDAKNTFIADDEVNEGLEDDDSDNSEDETHLFASVCAICDNGGDILCCEGRCLRSFHATKEAGIESNCKTLGYSSFEVEAINNFLCTNCEYKQHQCFACGLLGSSDKSVGAEVFACVNATCGHFYHPTCVARWLYRGNEAEAIACQKKIAAGGSFICPVHKCVVCNAGENKRVADMQLAMCRRCPKSYHRQCLPRKIAFQAIEEEDIKQRAWDGLLPSRILIYCLKHEMIDGFGTPIRNHLKFPELVKREEVAGSQKKKVKFSMVEKVEDFDSRPLKKTNHDIDSTAGDIKSKSMGVKKVVSVGALKKLLVLGVP